MSTMSVDDEMTYEQFGRQFFEIAVTEDRVGGAIAAIAGDEFSMGPMAQGPGKVAKVTAKVRIQEPRLTRHVGEMITFDIKIPLEIDLVVDLRIDKPKFMVFGEITLRATARAAAPLLLILDVEKPRPSDISIHVTSQVATRRAGADTRWHRRRDQTVHRGSCRGRDRQPGFTEGEGHRRRRQHRRRLVGHLVAATPSSRGRLGPRPSPLDLPRT